MRASCFALLKSTVFVTSVLAVVGCDDLLEVELPGRVPAEDLAVPARAGLLVAGAIADFECAYANYVTATALLTDELIFSTITGNVGFWDRRILSPSGAWTTADCAAGIDQTRLWPIGVYTPLSTARFQADDTYHRIEAWQDDEITGGAKGRAHLLANAAAYAGYSYVLFGEGFCAAAFDDSPLLTPVQVLELAHERFTAAITWAQQAGNDTILNMARVGRARVGLDLGRKTEAAADAKLVPKGFVKNATYSAANQRRMNYLYVQNYRDRITSVDTSFRNLRVDGVLDPRVRTIDAGRNGNDNTTPLWWQTKYTSESSPIPIASWDEAQLIIAEAEGGQSAVDRINSLRAQSSLPSFNSTSPAAIENQVREERRRELYLEGHRLNDMLRWKLPFATGRNHKGQPYGNTTCIPLPDIERLNNPNIR
jgi:hypothetical protein